MLTLEQGEAGGAEGTRGQPLLVLQWLDIESDSAEEEHGCGCDDDPGVPVLHSGGCVGHHYAEEGERGVNTGGKTSGRVGLGWRGAQLCALGVGMGLGQ